MPLTIVIFFKQLTDSEPAARCCGCLQSLSTSNLAFIRVRKAEAEMNKRPGTRITPFTYCMAMCMIYLALSCRFLFSTMTKGMCRLQKHQVICHGSLVPPNHLIGKDPVRHELLTMTERLAVSGIVNMGLFYSNTVLFLLVTQVVPIRVYTMEFCSSSHIENKELVLL